MDIFKTHVLRPNTHMYTHTYTMQPCMHTSTSVNKSFKQKSVQSTATALPPLPPSAAPAVTTPAATRPAVTLPRRHCPASAVPRPPQPGKIRVLITTDIFEYIVILTRRRFRDITSVSACCCCCIVIFIASSYVLPRYLPHYR